MKGTAKITGRVYFVEPTCGTCGAALRDRGFWKGDYEHPMNGCVHAGKTYRVSYVLPVELEET